MNKTWLSVAGGIAILMALSIVGCSRSAGPVEQIPLVSLTSASSVVSQDLAQLSAAGVTGDGSTGVFSIGWKKFVGPNISDDGAIGEAFAVVHPETSLTMVRSDGMDIGSVTLNYDGGSTTLTKHVTPDGGVLYETFSKGMRQMGMSPINIPFVANGMYSFVVGGSTAFSPGTFQITAPPSLLSFINHENRDTVSKNTDLTLQWQGGSATDSVLVRIVPHLRPDQMRWRETHGAPGGPGGRGGNRGRGGHREGPFIVGGPLEAMGPEFARGILLVIANAGSYTLSAADLQTLLNGTEAAELMIGITQIVKQNVLHDSRTLTVLLRNGDRLVLHVR
jgi:hypothetical protein